MPKEVLEVRIWDKTVGAVAYDFALGRHVFEYDPEWVERRIELAPLMMPLSQSREVFHFGWLPSAFHTLPGLLADSLPGDFGTPIVNAWMDSHHVPVDRIASLDRLSFQGRRGMGALEYWPTTGGIGERSGSFYLGALSKELSLFRRKMAWGGRIDTRDIPLLVRLGSVAAGAIPKAVVAYNPKTGEIRSGQFTAPAGFEHWLVKFDDVAGERTGSVPCRVEYAYHLMAKAAGIDVPESRLREEDGHPYFMTKRFDRDHNEKLHVQSFAALTHQGPENPTGLSYENLFKTTAALDLDGTADTQLLLRMAFNIAGHNCCDHPKNTAFTLREGGRWQLAPHFDLAYSPGPELGRRIMAVNGKRANITREDILSVAERFRVRGSAEVLGNVNAAIRRWPDFCSQAGLDEESMLQYAESHRTL